MKLIDRIRGNEIVKRLTCDAVLRTRVALLSAIIFNTGYICFQLCLGIYHSSFWYYSLAGYHLLLVFARFYLLFYTKRHIPGEDIIAELIRYRLCGCYLLILNFSLGVIVFFIVRLGKTFVHHEITAIAMAAYTFTALTLAIINTAKYRKYNSPVLSAAKIVSLVSASASMLTLETTMLTAFGQNEEEAFRGLMLTLSGSALSVLTVTMAVYMIVSSTKRIIEIKGKNKKQYESE